MSIAVTGAAGFVGRHVAAALRARGHGIVALTRRPLAGADHLLFDLQAAVPSEEELRRHDVTAVIHAAWDVSPRTLEQARRVNVVPSMRLAEAAKKAGACLIAVSSMSAFEGCRSVYGRAKLEMEQAVLAQGGLVLRPGLVWSDRPGGMVGTLDKLVRLPVVPVIAGGGKLYAVHADDLAEVIVRAVEAPAPPQTLTVAHPRAYGLREIMQRRASGRRLFLPVPWPLAWLAARIAEICVPKSGLRADSVSGLVHADRNPVFRVLKGVLEPDKLRPLKTPPWAENA